LVAHVSAEDDALLSGVVSDFIFLVLITFDTLVASLQVANIYFTHVSIFVIVYYREVLSFLQYTRHCASMLDILIAAAAIKALFPNSPTVISFLLAVVATYNHR
jgi:hypothetical protein